MTKLMFRQIEEMKEIDIDKNDRNKINERGEKRPKNVNSNLTKFAFLAEQRNRPSSQPRQFKIGGEKKFKKKIKYVPESLFEATVC